MKRLLFIFAVLIVLASTLAGCASSGSIPTITPTATISKSGIIANVNQAMNNINNYNVSVNETISGLIGQGISDSDLSLSGSGTIDQANQAFSFNMDTQPKSPETSPTASSTNNENTRMYMLNNKVYVGRTSNGTLQWSSFASGPDDWKQLSFVDVEKAMGLLDGASIKTSGEENIGQTPCYMLDVIPDPKKIFNMLSQPGLLSQDAEQVPFWDKISTNSSVKMWFDKDSYRLVRIGYKLDIKISSQDLGQPEGSPDASTSVQVDANYSNYNTAASIVIPDEVIKAAVTVPPPTTSSPAQTSPTDSPAPARQTYSTPPQMQIDTSKTYFATIDTSLGSFKIQLFASESPITVNNFIFLSKQGFYNGIIFHRVIQSFMIQTGDPRGDGTGDPGYKFADELPPKHKYDVRIVAMANSGPDTNGSQFFICTGADASNLNQYPNYTQFGQVISGMDIVQKIAAVPVGPGNPGEISRPVNPPVIKTILVTEQ